MFWGLQFSSFVLLLLPPLSFPHRPFSVQKVFEEAQRKDKSVTEHGFFWQQQQQVPQGPWSLPHLSRNCEEWGLFGWMFPFILLRLHCSLVQRRRQEGHPAPIFFHQMPSLQDGEFLRCPWLQWGIFSAASFRPGLRPDLSFKCSRLQAAVVQQQSKSSDRRRIWHAPVLEVP